tara:strand:- start:62 stop:316 length:255 start_codon:yes stop_codon:yes gene_type:complete
MYNIYGLKWCIFCLRAINFMQEKGLEFHYYPMDDQERVLDYIKETHDHKTVPIITQDIDGEEMLIGGYDDLVKCIRQQENKTSN